MRLCNPLCVTIGIVLLAVATYAGDAEQRFQQVADRLVKAINEQDNLSIQQDFGQVMLDAFPLERSKPFFKDLIANYGKIGKLDNPRLLPLNQAVFPAHFERVVLDIKIVLDNQDKIVGLWFLPHTPTIPAPDRHETVFALPFEGKWFVFWGGDTKEMNHHHDTPNQRYACDFVVTDGTGKTHKGEGTRNEDYYAFGQAVRAPADGVVTDVIRGVRDNIPGSMNPYSALGNAVVIQHRQHEVSVLAHFKQGSIRVRVGEKVTRGQVLGLCGNSGNASEPHVHYHLQNTPIIQDGTGMKCVFENITVTRNGMTVLKKRYSPVKNDVVEQERPARAALDGRGGADDAVR